MKNRKKHLHGQPLNLQSMKMEVAEEAMRLMHAK